MRRLIKKLINSDIEVATNNKQTLSNKYTYSSLIIKLKVYKNNQKYNFLIAYIYLPIITMYIFIFTILHRCISKAISIHT